MIWKDIDETTPQDELVLLRKNFEAAETPLIVIGEVVTFRGAVHHLSRGAYDNSIKCYKEVDPKWDEKFAQWSPIDSV